MKSIFFTPPRRYFRRLGTILFLLLTTTGIKADNDVYMTYLSGGFTYFINTSATTPYAVIGNIPNQESVTLASSVSYKTRKYVFFISN